MLDKPIAKVKYRGKRIKVYADDCGQCYYFVYNGESYGCGTYNTDYLGEIVSVVDDDLDKMFHVGPFKARRPSAKIYQRHGVWYMDYFSYDGLLLSYGDLLPKDERPSRDELEARARDVIGMIEENDGKDS